ncbi:hypothetical protein LCM19_02195 [Qipengyuania flava]|nr:hypothetical protein [Qipengyuania flava]
MRILVMMIQTELYKPVNNYLIPKSLRELGHDVILGDVDSLVILENVVCIKAAQFEGADVGDHHVRMETLISCEDFDAIWLLDYAHHSKEREFFQILWVLEQRVVFVNRPSSMLFINNKIGVFGLRLGRHFAPTCVVQDEQAVKDIVAKDEVATWVIKPPNAGCGAGVFMLAEGDPNFSTLIQAATGNAYQKYEMYTREAYGLAEQYTIVQKFIPEIRQTENRVVVAGGRIVGGYKKTSVGAEFRGNYAVGGIETAMDICSSARDLCSEVGTELMSYGINYVGIDLAYPHIVELNMVNPGGISGQLNATGEDIGPAACQGALEAATSQDARTTA